MDKERHPLMYDRERIVFFGVEQCQYWMDLAVITDRLSYDDPRQEEKRKIARQWGQAKMQQVQALTLDLDSDVLAEQNAPPILCLRCGCIPCLCLTKVDGSKISPIEGIFGR